MDIVLIRHSETSPTPDISTPLWRLTKEEIVEAEELNNKEFKVFYNEAV